MYNKIILVGNLTRDVEIRYTQSGTAIGNTGIATNKKWKDQSGQQKEEVMFVDIVFFGRSAEIANQYLRRGSKTLIEGRLRLDQWTDQGGQKRSKHSVTVETMKMLDGNPNNQNNQNNQNGGGYQNNAYQNNAPQGGGYEGGNGNRNANNSEQQNARQPEEIPEIDVDDDEIPF